MRHALVFVFGTAVVASCTTTPTPERSETPSGEPMLAQLRTRFPRVLERRPEREVLARVTLPPDTAHELLIEDPRSGIRAGVRLEDRAPSARVTVDGLALYPEAGVVMRAHDDGVEDFVSLESEAARREVVYLLRPSPGAGLRLVERNLELLDEGGSPRLRMNPPWIMDARGQRHEATIAIEGCAFDQSPAPPWGRPTTSPGNASCRIRIGWPRITYPALLDPSWTVTTSAGDRFDHVAVKMTNGRVLVTYGDAGGTLAGGAYDYNPATKSFASVAGPGGKVTHTSGVGLPNGLALVLGPNTVGGQLYNPALGTFSDTGPSTIERSSGSTATLLASGKVLCVGGGSTGELYDPTGNTFTLTPPLKAAHSQHTASLLADGKVLIAGGSAGGSAEIYDPVQNTFTLTGSMTVARKDHRAVTLASGRVFLAGGTDDLAKPLASTELFDPATGKFTSTTPLSDARSGLELALMRSGNVYVIGGFVAGIATPVVERYEPATAQLGVAPFLKVPRGGHRVALLDSGVLLATGGKGAESTLGVATGAAEELSVTAPGALCAIHDDCSSGICDQGICCAAACNGICQSCAATTGQCLVVTNADDPSSCTGDSTCDAAGACKKKNGRACAESAECASGACADGVCCNRACTSVCEACDGANRGTCETVAGKPHGSRSCASDGSSCGGACDGTIVDQCGFPGTSTGCGTRCETGVLTASACDGKGACITRGPRPCPGNFACADDKICRTSCTVNGDCARGYACEGGKCAPTAFCDGDHAIIAADGKSKTECAPFRCDTVTNRCRTSCEDVEQCAAPFLCERDGQCVAPPTAPSGCTVNGLPRSTRRSSGLVFAAGIVLATLLARRRSR